MVKTGDGARPKMPAASPPELYVPPTVEAFTSHQALRQRLTALSQATVIGDVAGAADLLLDDAGRTRAGFRFTSTGLKQVCTVASPGSFRLVRDISGMLRGPENPREEYNFAYAVKLYNRLVKLRLARFVGVQRLLLNVKDRLIEGVLGPRYTLVENITVLDQADEAAAGRPGQLRLREAGLCGRHLRLRYVAAAPLVDVAVDAGVNDSYHDGLFFVNSEIGGESSFRAALLLWRPRDSIYAMGSFLGGRKVHAGRRFHENLTKVFSRAASTLHDADMLRDGFARLLTAKLSLCGGDDDRRRRLRRIVDKLVDVSVPRTLAELAVALAASVGPVALGAAAAGVAGKAPAVYRLFDALARQGRGLVDNSREAVEQAAYRLLTGQLRVGGKA